MIRNIGLLLLLMFCASKLKAQDGTFMEEPKPFTGGLVFGTNICKVDDIDDFTHYHYVGLNAGGIVHINFTPTFSVAMEMLYSQKGDIDVNQSTSNAIGAYFASYYLRLKYIEVPITLHLKQKKMDYEVGASYSRLISSYESISLDYPVIIDPLVNYFNKTDYEFIIGGSYNFYKHYFFNVRYEFSMTPIRPGERLPVDYWYDGQQNNVFNFRLIYMFN